MFAWEDPIKIKHSSDVLLSGKDALENWRARSSAAKRIIVPGVTVVREGCAEPLLDALPTLSSASVQWQGLALECYTTPAVLVSRHQHPEHFMHMVLRGTVKYEATTGGRNLRFTSYPGQFFLLPKGTVDEINWMGGTERLAVAIHPRLLTNALEETAPQVDVELIERWGVSDRHISALLLEMQADLADNSPAGIIYGESLANSLAVYLLSRYAVWKRPPVVYKGGLSGYRLKRVLDYIAENMNSGLTLSQLSAIAGMSPHYFSELFKQSTGFAPYRYILLQRIEYAKQHLCNPKLNIIDAGLEAGFQNSSHFARVFRRVVGVSPSSFRADCLPNDKVSSQAPMENS
jgi:AraC family transcriptional regulator